MIPKSMSSAPIGDGTVFGKDHAHEDDAMIVMAFVFIVILLAGVPVFIALAGASFIYTHFTLDCRIRHPASHGGRHRFVPAARGAVFHSGRQSDEFGRHHHRIYDFAVALAGWTRAGSRMSTSSVR